MEVNLCGVPGYQGVFGGVWHIVSFRDGNNKRCAAHKPRPLKRDSLTDPQFVLVQTVIWPETPIPSTSCHIRDLIIGNNV